MVKYIQFWHIIILSLLLIVHTGTIGQNGNSTDVSLNMSIEPTALIDFVVEGEQTISFNPNSGQDQTSIEQIITPSTADNTWLNYSSIVNDGSTNYITVHISSGSLPADVELKLIVDSDVGQGEGQAGEPIQEVTITSYPQNIINNIGSCYTGIGIQKGHRLTYIWENPESFNYNLNYGNGEIIAVTYTISTTE